VSEKRFVAHDTWFEDYEVSLESKKHKREDEARCEVAGRIFEKYEKNDEREVHTIKPAESNKYITESIINNSREY